MVEQWTPQKANDWYASIEPIRGCNYLPRTAVNSTEMWQAESFDPEAIAEELAWAQAAGFNGVRVFLQYIVWQADPAGLKSRIDQFLDIAGSCGIKAMFIVFDDCAFAGKEPYLGPQDDPVPYVHNSGWTPSPGLKRVMDRSVWPALKDYVVDIVGSFANDERVQIWDLYNEPGNSEMGEGSLPLVEASFEWAREAGAGQPLTTSIFRMHDALRHGGTHIGIVRCHVVSSLRRGRRRTDHSALSGLWTARALYRMAAAGCRSDCRADLADFRPRERRLVQLGLGRRADADLSRLAAGTEHARQHVLATRHSPRRRVAI